jgi:quercetin dioxygenase-like cupin family protein
MGSFARQRHHSYSVIPFLLGCLLGYTLRGRSDCLNTIAVAPEPLQSTVASGRQAGGNDNVRVMYAKDIVPSATSHIDPITGQAVMKRQFVPPFPSWFSFSSGIPPSVNNLAGISLATLPAGAVIERHAHASMHEFFYVVSGQGTYTVRPAQNRDHGAANTRDTRIDKIEYDLQPGAFVHAYPGDQHEFQAKATSTGGSIHDHSDLQMLVIGLTTSLKPP